jgi:hypothetical protein
VKNYSHEYAKYASNYAGAAYCEEDSVNNWDCGTPCDISRNFKTLHYFKVNTFWDDNHAYMGYEDNKLEKKESRYVIAFRGTVTTTQLLKQAYNRGKVEVKKNKSQSVLFNNYFYVTYTAFRPEIQKAVNAVVIATKYVKTEWLVTGHSLGGALATICALDLSRSGFVGKNWLRLYTYGQPRTGDPAAAAMIDQAIYHFRIVNKGDLVPHVPPMYSKAGLAWTKIY